MLTVHAISACKDYLATCFAKINNRRKERLENYRTKQKEKKMKEKGNKHLIKMFFQIGFNSTSF